MTGHTEVNHAMERRERGSDGDAVGGKDFFFVKCNKTFESMKLLPVARRVMSSLRYLKESAARSVAALGSAGGPAPLRSCRRC